MMLHVTATFPSQECLDRKAPIVTGADGFEFRLLGFDVGWIYDREGVKGTWLPLLQQLSFS